MSNRSNLNSRNRSAIRKIPGGKLVRVDARAGKTIERVCITGDFFLFPEEALDEIETALCGLPLPLNTANAEKIINQVLRSQQAEMIGVSPQELVITLQEALA